MWTDPDLAICGTYAWQAMGGSLATLPSGITNAIMTNVGAILIMKLIKKIRLVSKHFEVHFIIFSIALMTYINSGLLVMYGYANIVYLPHVFTTDWIIFYGKMIKTSMLLSQLMPYAGKLKILCKRGCCCCVRKRYRPDTMNNPVFPKERRYASLLAIVFISFTYGAILPLIFVIASFILIT